MNIVNQYTKMCIGENSLDILKEIKNSKIFIISDEFLVKNLIINKVTEKIDSSNKVKIFDKVKPDPSLTIVSNAIKETIEFGATHIIGFGGGSAMDTAKGVKYYLNESEDIKKDVEFIAIPTTSGTGSEVTSVTVITDEENQTKHALIDDDILPDVAILYTDFTMSLSPSVIANTGMDVLTHIIEAYVAKGANDFSDAKAEKSGELVVKYLFKSYSEKDNYLAKEKMLIASNLAGHAFNIAGLGLNHSIAHQIGGIYHVPHGLANSILLTSVIDFNSKNEEVKKRYVQFARETSIADSTLSDDMAFEVLKRYIETMMNLMDMPQKISLCNIDRATWEENKLTLAQNAMQDNCLSSNPVDVSVNDIIEILDRIY